MRRDVARLTTALGFASPMGRPRSPAPRVAPARLRGDLLRHDGLADRRERAARELEVLDRERDPDDRDEVHDRRGDVADREPDPGEQEPDDVAEEPERAGAEVALAGQLPAVDRLAPE